MSEKTYWELRFREEAKENDALKARIAELEAAVEDAVDTLESMDLHVDNPLYVRLRTVLQAKAEK